MMAHPRFPVAGEAHHPLVAGVLVAAYRNAGGEAGATEIVETELGLVATAASGW